MRNSFKTPLVVEVMPSGKRFRLFFDFTYYWKRQRLEIHVPKGFVTDFASIPRPFRILIPKLGRYNKAAVLHDFLYQTQHYSRAQTDYIFLNAMVDLDVAGWKANLMYWCVRLGGWLAWRKR